MRICVKPGTDKPLLLAAFEPALPELISNVPNQIFERFITYISSAYMKTEFANKSSMSYQTLKQIYQMAVSDGYSIKEFGVLVKRFVKSNPFENFSLGNFFKSERLNLYPVSWMKSETGKNINAVADMEAFEITSGENKVTMYRYFSPDNPKIDNPNIRILSKSWDPGGLYQDQYKNPIPVNNAEVKVCSNCEAMKMRLKDANELIEHKSRIILQMQNELVELSGLNKKLKRELQLQFDKNISSET